MKGRVPGDFHDFQRGEVAFSEIVFFFFAPPSLFCNETRSFA